MVALLAVLATTTVYQPFNPAIAQTAHIRDAAKQGPEIAGCNNLASKNDHHCQKSTCDNGMGFESCLTGPIPRVFGARTAKATVLDHSKVRDSTFATLAPNKRSGLLDIEIFQYPINDRRL